MTFKKLLHTPAKKMDVPLLKECMKTIDPVYEKAGYPNQDAVWTRIRTSMPKASRISKQRIAAFVLAAILALGLIGAAAAYFMRDIFNFTFDAGWDKSRGSVQKSAYRLNNENLVHLEFEHTDLDILQAVYDGHELRVVYSLWWRDATEPLPIAPGSEYIDVSCFSQDGIMQMCDWIEVNGQDAFFSDIHTVRGEKNGQALFYLQSNLMDWNIEPTDELVIGLPVIARGPDEPHAGIGKATPETTFKINMLKGEGLYFKAEEMQPIVVDYYPIRVYMGRFSPVSSVLRIEILDIDGTFDPDDWETPHPIWDYGYEWGNAVLCDMDFNPIGITSVEAWGHPITAEGPTVTVHYSITPPEKWPKRAQLVMKNQDGTLNKAAALPFNIIPDDSYLN